MRTCGGCNLCCKLARIPDLNKPTNVWCKFCEIGKGCTIYGDHPQACKDFSCLWLLDETLSDEMRPDRVHLYPSGNVGDEVLKIIVDPEHAESWKTGQGAKVVSHFLDRGFHLLIVNDKQINFLNGAGRPQPEKLVVDWLL